MAKAQDCMSKGIGNRVNALGESYGSCASSVSCHVVVGFYDILLGQDLRHSSCGLTSIKLRLLLNLSMSVQPSCGIMIWGSASMRKSSTRYWLYIVPPAFRSSCTTFAWKCIPPAPRSKGEDSQLGDESGVFRQSSVVTCITLQ